MKTKKRIIIVDDHNMFVDGLSSILSQEEDMKIVLTASSAHQVIKYLTINTEEHIDLVITDINMPEMDGITLNRLIKKDFPSIKTLVVSMLHDAQKIKTLTEDNVNGYISKNTSQQELLNAIRSIMLGNNYFGTNIKELLLNALLSAKKEKRIKLTTREKEVLKLIAKEYTTQEIADILFLSKHTIESYRKNLISKLNVRNLAGLTRYAIESGLDKVD